MLFVRINYFVSSSNSISAIFVVGLLANSVLFRATFTVVIIYVSHMYLCMYACMHAKVSFIFLNICLRSTT